MIQTKADLKDYIKADKKQLGISRPFPRPFTDEIWKFEITLRKYEYWKNQMSLIAKIMCFYYKWKSSSRC